MKAWASGLRSLEREGAGKRDQLTGWVVLDMLGRSSTNSRINTWKSYANQWYLDRTCSWTWARIRSVDREVQDLGWRVQNIVVWWSSVYFSSWAKTDKPCDPWLELVVGDVSEPLSSGRGSLCRFVGETSCLYPIISQKGSLTGSLRYAHAVLLLLMRQLELCFMLVQHSTVDLNRGMLSRRGHEGLCKKALKSLVLETHVLHIL